MGRHLSASWLRFAAGTRRQTVRFSRIAYVRKPPFAVHDPPHCRLLTAKLILHRVKAWSSPAPAFRRTRRTRSGWRPLRRRRRGGESCRPRVPHDAKAPATFARRAGGELDWSLVLRTTFSLSKTAAFILRVTPWAMSSAWLNPRFASRERYSGTGTTASNVLPSRQPERTSAMSGAITFSKIRRYTPYLRVRTSYSPTHSYRRGARASSNPKSRLEH